MNITCKEQIVKKIDGKEETIECGKSCEPKHVAQFTKITWICPDDHKQTLTMDSVKKSERMCPACAKEGHKEFMLHYGLSNKEYPPITEQSYHLKCLNCGETWVEEVHLRKKDAYRFRKEPTLEMEVA